MSMFLKVSIAFTMLCLASGLFAEEISLGQLRAKFEGVVEAEGVEYDTKSKVMRDSYIGALERLKDSLGREGKLEQATHILSEIDGLEESEKIQELPKDADYRFKRLRSTWEHEQRKLDENRSTKLFEFGKVYIRTLDARKKALTREGEIREALVVDEELKRVRDWEAAEKARFKEEAATDEGELSVKDLEKYLEGKVFSYVRKGAAPKKIRFEAKGEASYGGDLEVKIRWKQVKDTFTLILTMTDSRTIEIELSSDGTSFKGKQDDGERRRGRLLKE